MQCSRSFLVVVMFSLLSLGTARADVPDPLTPSGRVPDWPKITIKVVDPELVVEDEEGRRFPANQMLVLLAGGTPRNVAQQVAEAHGGTVVGEIETAGLYQLELPFTTVAELEAALESVRSFSGVAAAACNGLEAEVVQEGEENCPPSSDNNTSLLTHIERCAMRDISYFQTLTLIEHFRDDLSFGPVKVAVVDTGVDYTHSEFFYLYHPGPRRLSFLERCMWPQDRFMHRPIGEHGSTVASVIAAREDGSGISGIASRVLGSRLWLTIGNDQVILLPGNTAQDLPYETSGTVYWDLVLIALAAEREGASIMNASWIHDLDEDGIILFKEVVGKYQDRLLIVAGAGNDQVELDGSFRAPGGLDLPNVLTVTGSAECEPMELSDSRACYGGREHIQVAAPSHKVPVANVSGSGSPFLLRNGTSHATPLVTSLAAILKSLYPSMSPAELKRVIDGRAVGFTVGLVEDHWGYQYTRFDMFNTLARQFLRSPPADVVRDYLLSPNTGDLEAMGVIMGRLCGKLNVTARWGTETRTHEFSFDDIYQFSPEYGFSLSEGANLNAMTTLPDGASFSFQIVERFNIGQPTPLTTVVYMSNATDLCALTGVGAQTGELVIEGCWIEQWDPNEGTEPLNVTLKGRLSAPLTFIVGCQNPTTHQGTVEAEFDLPFFNWAWDRNPEANTHIKDTCGWGRTPPEEPMALQYSVME